MDQHRVPLCDCDVYAGDTVRLDERAVDFDHVKRVGVDAEPDGAEGSGVDEAEAVCLVGFEGKLEKTRKKGMFEGVFGTYVEVGSASVPLAQSVDGLWIRDRSDIHGDNFY